MGATVLTVKQLNGYVKSLLEGDFHLTDLYLKGEISNFKNHYQSGHLYFSLKDRDAVIRAVMFRFAASTLRFEPCDGMEVICRGRVSLYEKDGSYQFYVEEMIPDGIGALSIAYEQIKERLAAKGYFDERYKKAIPLFPENIAVITSDTGAAVQDIINIISRRYPVCTIILCPVHVQGELAVPDMIDALRRLRSLDDIDTIIIGRGGGSIEDLWAFNSEELAEEIFGCEIPVISAVGHETDFTICDFVSDLRAPTPSAAAELAVPDINELRLLLDGLNDRMVLSQNTRIENLSLKFTALRERSALSKANVFFENTERTLEQLKDKLSVSFARRIDKCAAALAELVAKLDALSPLSVLARGYGVVSLDDKIVSSVNDLSRGDRLSVRFGDGTAECIVESVKQTSEE